MGRWRAAARSLHVRADGSAAVEFALIVPMLIAIFAGICVFGIYLGTMHGLRHLAAEAARASVPGMTDGERAVFAKARIAQGTGPGTIFPAGSVDVAVGPDAADASIYVVTLTYDARRLGLGAFSGVVAIPPDYLKASYSVRKGGA